MPANGAAVELSRNLTVPALSRTPDTVEFRPAADLRKVADTVASKTSVFLDAAVGSGKSTKFPVAFAERTRSLVVHVTPNPLLAQVLCSYVRSAGVGAAARDKEFCNHVSAVAGDLPRRGVLYMGCATLVSLLLASSGKFPVPGATLIIDEAHESDAYTHVLRNLAFQFGFARLVQSSATLAPAGSRVRETPGKILPVKYDPSYGVEEWDVGDPSKPWCYQSFNKALVFVDSHTKAKALLEQYSIFGVLGFRLKASSSKAEYDAAVRCVNDKTKPVTVIVADYSFRSGFTFDVDVVIDSCEVGFNDPRPGQFRRCYRSTYQAENVQAAGRAGRVSSATVKYCYPDRHFEPKICDLEGTEREAAAYVYRLLGYQPNGVLKSVMMASAYLPEGVRPMSALNGAHPLTCHVVDSTGALRSSRAGSPVGASRDSSSRRDSGVDCGHVGTGGGSVDAFKALVPYGTAVPAPGLSGGSPREESVPRPKPAAVKTSAKSPPSSVKPLSPGERQSSTRFMEHFSSPAGDDKRVVGRYYHVEDVPSASHVTPTFPMGLESVRKFFSGPSSAYDVAGLRSRDVKAALSLVLERYNELNVELWAIDQVKSELESEPNSAEKRSLIRFAADLLERQGAMKSERRELHSELLLLARNRYDLDVIEPFRDLEARRLRDWRSRLKSFKTDALSTRESAQERVGSLMDVGRHHHRHLHHSKTSRPRHLASRPTFGSDKWYDNNWDVVETYERTRTIYY